MKISFNVIQLQLHNFYDMYSINMQVILKALQLKNQEIFLITFSNIKCNKIFILLCISQHNAQKENKMLYLRYPTSKGGLLSH